jgi:membrane-associated protease RseP (regulator of RpoE activity)
MNYLIVPAAFIFILGSAVVLHEFGHFIVAKLFGIRAEIFS